jgi:aspartyl-tRNA(Asn)/glutamyl-tRNA(Gln) amidotransferase subunit A
VSADRAHAEDRIRACLRDIALRNPALNAFLAVDEAGALAAARDSDARARRGESRGVLDGMPIAIKDNIDVADLPATAGIGAYRTRRPAADARCVGRLRMQGAAILGKTHMDEAALSALGDNPHFGRCDNPNRPDTTPGGSSSGSAAAVAAGLCVAALGTDTLGSVRIPASYCGIVGYLPSAGRNDMEGIVPLAPSFDRLGVLARSVADAVAVAAALSDRRESPGAPETAMIGVITGPEQLAAPGIRSGIEAAARRLAEAGHRVADMPGDALDWDALRKAAFLVTEVEGARVHAALLDDPRAAISPGLRRALEYGRHAGADRIDRCARELERARAALSRMLSSFDLLLLPTTPQVAFAFGAPVPATQADFTAPANVAGLAAISVPAGTLDGLPFGAQLVGRSDALLLRAATALG